MPGSLLNMQISGFTDEDFSAPFHGGKPYFAMINPSSIQWNRSIEYNSKQPPGTLSPSQKYKSTPAQELSFDLIIDCTGVVNILRIVMEDEIQALTSLIYQYHGKSHRPNFLVLQWGQTMFKCVLKSMNTSYTLFRPNGSPLRAKVSLAFTEYICPKAVIKASKNSSPDISHSLNVVQGDSLPGLCNKIWRDDMFYIQAAEYNGLNKFRKLKGGNRLIFPPIVQPTSIETD